MSETPRGATVEAVGVGPGGSAHPTPVGRRSIETADVVVGFDSAVDRVRDLAAGAALACSSDDEADRLARVGEYVADGASATAVFAGDPSVYERLTLDGESETATTLGDLATHAGGDRPGDSPFSDRSVLVVKREDS